MTSPAQDGFVPLAMTPARKDARDSFQVLVAPCPENARRLGDVVPASTPVAVHTGPSPGCQPKVALHREGDRIIGLSNC